MKFRLTFHRLISTQVYSLWDNEPPRPAIPRFTLPECYTVGNVAPLETKLANLNDEALIFMFYSNPGDVQQLLAASELYGLLTLTYTHADFSADIIETGAITRSFSFG